MRDEEDPEPARLQVAEQVQDVDARRGVEHADDLVRDQEPDVEQERPRDEEALELAAAQLVRVLVQAVAALRLTASSAASTFASHSPRPTRGKKPALTIAKTRSALKIGLYELNGSWKTPCTRR